MKTYLSFFLNTVILFLTVNQNISFSQNLVWSTYIDTSTTFSSPRCVDLNGDSIKDIVIGGGLDGTPQSNGVIALDGQNGNILWNFFTEEEIFTSSQFIDITGDFVKDIIIGGRNAELYAINGQNGEQIWEFFPYSPTQSIDSGWFNFYTPQIIPDQNNDGFSDLLISNGGNHSAPIWDTLREPGMLMVLDATTGNILAKDTMPDGEETYCSPIILDNGGTLDIIYGSGGENDGGSLWRVSLTDLMNNDISNSIMLAHDEDLGFIAPSSLADINGDNQLDIINQAYDGTIRCIDGNSNTLIWEVTVPNTESSAAPTIGNFIGDKTPDVFNVLYKGSAPTFFDFYQIMIDGKTGEIAFIDSIGDMQYGSSVACDLDMNGRDEVIISVNHINNGYFNHQLLTIDFQNNSVTPFFNSESGVNIASTPLIDDIDNDGFLNIIYAYRADSVNPMAQNGFYINCLEGLNTIPGVGIAWGNYMGTNGDGQYNYLGEYCGMITPNLSISEISCNHFNDGGLSVSPSGGTFPYTFLWNNGSILDSIGNLGIGTYSVLITDSSGCTTEISHSLDNPFVISFGGITPLSCPGDSTGQATVNSSGCPCMFSTCAFDWSSGDSTKTATSLSSGWNYITITHMNGCIVEDSIFMNEPYPILDSIYKTDILCASEPFSSSMIQLYLHDSLATEVIWSTGDSTLYLDSLISGNYYFDLNDNRGCFYSDTIEILSPDSLFISIELIWNDSTGNCSGGASSIISGGVPPYSLVWSDSFNSTQNTINNLCEGTYTLTVTDDNNCQINESIQILNTLLNEEFSSKNGIIIYPNPANNLINIESTNEIQYYELFNAQGRLVIRDVCSSKKLQIPTKYLETGMYSIRLSYKSYQQVQKIVIN